MYNSQAVGYLYTPLTPATGILVYRYAGTQVYPQSWHLERHSLQVKPLSHGGRHGLVGLLGYECDGGTGECGEYVKGVQSIIQYLLTFDLGFT